METSNPVYRHLSSREVDSYWRATGTQEPVSDALKTAVKEDLIRAWHSLHEATHRADTKSMWSTLDTERMVLADSHGTVDTRTCRYMCNKPTAMYWLPTAQRTDNTGERSQMPSIILAAIYEEWKRCYDDKPRLNNGHFFANPIRITSAGPTTVRGIIHAHASLCGQARTVSMCNNGRYLATDQYALHPLYATIVVILAELEIPESEPEGFISLQKLVVHQTVLVALTEEGIRQSISLEPLQRFALPLNQTELADTSTEVIRVSLAAAIRFIVSVEKTLDEATGRCKPPVDHHLLRRHIDRDSTFDFGDWDESEVWAKGILHMAEERGWDNVRETWISIRRVQAATLGEEFFPLDQQPWSSRWK